MYLNMPPFGGYPDRLPGETIEDYWERKAEEASREIAANDHLREIIYDEADPEVGARFRASLEEDEEED
jgi:hypothetical protein